MPLGTVLNFFSAVKSRCCKTCSCHTFFSLWQAEYLPFWWLYSSPVKYHDKQKYFQEVALLLTLKSPSSLENQSKFAYRWKHLVRTCTMSYCIWKWNGIRLCFVVAKTWCACHVTFFSTRLVFCHLCCNTDIPRNSHEAPRWHSTSFLLPASSNLTLGEQGSSKALFLHKSFFGKKIAPRISAAATKRLCIVQRYAISFCISRDFPSIPWQTEYEEIARSSLVPSSLLTTFNLESNNFAGGKRYIFWPHAPDFCKLSLHMSAADICNM